MKCYIENCEKPAKAKGLCARHYMLIKRNGGLIYKRPPDNGRRKLAEYRIWAHIKERCTNPNTKCYKHYGEREIKMCDRWINNFDNFLEDMGKRPSSKHQIDREDNNGNYEPSNCRWTTQLINLRNKRTTLTNEQIIKIKLLLLQGISNIIIATEMKIHPTKISNIKRGYSYADQVKGIYPSK